MAYLTCQDLAVGYGSMAVAEGICCTVGAHDLLCVVGENGAGKSTFLKTLLGIATPLSGTITFGDGCAAGEVGYLPQSGETQRDFPASVWEIVLSGRLPRMGSRPFFGKADRVAAEEALAQTGALELRNRPFSHLSGGQQQRVLLARALTAASKLIALDEPTTGLDPVAATALWEVLDGLREQGVGIIAVTHDVDEALTHATHVLSLGQGSPEFSAVVDGAIERGGC